MPTETSWNALVQTVRRELRSFCALDPEGPCPTRECLNDAIRETWTREGWCLYRVGDPTEWHTFLVTLRELDGVMLPPPAWGPQTAWHRYVAAAHLLGWCEAPWSIHPAPWDRWVQHWPGNRPAAPVTLPPPHGWPGTRPIVLMIPATIPEC